MNRRIFLLNGLAMLAVVANHATLDGYVAMFWWTDRYLPVAVPNFDQLGSFSYYWLVFQQKLALFSVPAFLFVTGIFIAYTALGSAPTIKWKVIKNRILNLIPPFLIWFAVYILGMWTIKDPPAISKIFWTLVGCSSLGFFFVPMLMELLALSPWIVKTAKTNVKRMITIAILVQVSILVISYVLLFLKYIPQSNSKAYQLLDFIPSIRIYEFGFYYVLGIICGFNLKGIKELTNKYRWGLLFSTVIFGLLAILEGEWLYRVYEVDIFKETTLTLPTFLYILSFIFCFIGFENSSLPFSNLIYRIGRASFGIYLVHFTVMAYLPKAIYHLVPKLMGIQILFQIVLILFSIGIPLLLMEIIRKSPISKYYRYIFG